HSCGRHGTDWRRKVWGACLPGARWAGRAAGKCERLPCRGAGAGTWHFGLGLRHSRVTAVMPPLITLTTDFGTGSPYVAAMKGVILGINHEARIIDLSHDIPPQDIRHVAFFLAEALPYFPPQALHVVVVDPGVGSARSILHVTVAGQRLLVPDN